MFWRSGSPGATPVSLSIYSTKRMFSTCTVSFCADVGGGSVTDSVSLSLSQITLHWMLREVVSSQCGIIFDHEALQRLDFNPDQFNVGQLHLQLQPQPQPQPTESNPDTLEAETPLHDQLTMEVAGWGAPMWWILELIPLQLSNQDGKGVWRTYWR